MHTVLPNPVESPVLERRLAMCLCVTIALFATSSVSLSAPASSVTKAGNAPAQRLDWLVGNWSVHQSFWTDTSKAPTIDTGSAVFSSVLSGRHLRQELRIDSAKPFHGLGYLGYDAGASRYDSLWMDVNFGGVVVAHGNCTAEGRACTFLGEMSGAHGASVPVREELQAKDANHFSYAYYESHAGKEVLTVKLDYTRVR